MPWVDAFLVEDAIPRSAASYDLVLAASVFTHLLDWEWWMLEIRRVLVAGGLLLATFVGPGMYAEFGEPDGMAVLNSDQSWDLGGPIVVHQPWWIREHWGRLLDIVELHNSGFAHPDDRSRGSGVVLLRHS